MNIMFHRYDRVVTVILRQDFHPISISYTPPVTDMSIIITTSSPAQTRTLGYAI